MSIFPIGAVIYYVTTNLFSLGQQFYVLRKFPPPPISATAGGPSIFGNRAPKETPAKSGSGSSLKNGVPVRTSVKPTKNGSVSSSTTAPEVRAVAPKVGAKPVNPKKGSASKR